MAIASYAVCHICIYASQAGGRVYRVFSAVFTQSAVVYSTIVQGLADARKRAHRSGLVQFFAVYQFDRVGGILQMCHTVGELCNHAVRGSVVRRLISDTICEFTVNSVF